ncbi:hypothetical protein [Micromonospora echinospora]|uniref:hypothetical protein n=1 Tax=Micromonospora echinospora TaxID=1877 RepID=UPI003A8966EC
MAHRSVRRPLLCAAVTGRVAWAGLLLLAPGTLLRPVGPTSTVAVATLRVLGARHLAQAAVTVHRPTPGTLGAGAAVDGIHAFTALALAAVDRRQRRAALADAAIAAAWAVLGTVAGRHEGEP